MKENKTYEWNLGLLYKGPKDPQIEKDVIAIEKACADFEKKYKGKDFTSTPKKLLSALQDSEQLKEKMLGHKPWWYFELSSHMNSDDIYARAMATKYEQRISLATNKITFFELDIAHISKSNQKKLLTSKELKTFSYKLQKIFEGAKYMLSEKEENIINLLTQSAYSSWVSGQQKLLFSKTVEHEGKQISLSEAREIIPELPKKERRDLHKKMYSLYKEVSHFAESEMNAIVNFKKVIDERRGHTKPYSSVLLSNENDEKSIEALASSVAKYFSVSHQFYKLHAKLLKEKTLQVADVRVQVGKIKQEFTFEKSVEIVRNGFKKIGAEYVQYFDEFLKQGQIDVYPRKGKWSGGYCWKIGNNPTFILLNHSNTFHSVETLAHEMGHAFHYELTRKEQPLTYEEVSTSTAEVASTFFEQVINSELEELLSEKEKVILLHNNINRDIQTIFIQIACFNFETELHQKIKEEGALSKEKISKLMVKHMSACRGKSVEMSELDGYHFVSWPHIRMFFYTYTYAFGHLVSKVMYEKWKQNPAFESKVREFLSAGNSMSPTDIFKKMGIDITDPAFFETGLKAIEADIKKLEKLAKQQGMLK
jgi:oligoendopeptidase F